MFPGFSKYLSWPNICRTTKPKCTPPSRHINKKQQ